MLELAALLVDLLLHLPDHPLLRAEVFLHPRCRFACRIDAQLCLLVAKRFRMPSTLVGELLLLRGQFLLELLKLPAVLLVTILTAVEADRNCTWLQSCRCSHDHNRRVQGGARTRG